MKNTRGHTERTLKEIRELLQLGLSPTYCRITPREATTSEQEDREWFGVNADAEGRRFREETGDAR